VPDASGKLIVLLTVAGAMKPSVDVWPPEEILNVEEPLPCKANTWLVH